MPDLTEPAAELLVFTTEIVSAHVGNNRLPSAELPNLISAVHAALAGLGRAEEPASSPPEHVPAVSVRKSLADPKFIVSMIDGKAYMTLKRHLGRHGLTPATYRERFGLKADYPMVAPAYTEARRAIAKTIGLGRKAGSKVIEAAKAVEEKVEQVVAPKPAARRGRKPKTGTPAA